MENKYYIANDGKKFKELWEYQEYNGELVFNTGNKEEIKEEIILLDEDFKRLTFDSMMKLRHAFYYAHLIYIKTDKALEIINYAWELEFGDKQSFFRINDWYEHDADTGSVYYAYLEYIIKEIKRKEKIVATLKQYSE